MHNLKIADPTERRGFIGGSDARIIMGGDEAIDLSWEILRYRRLKQKILEISRVAAIEALLRRADSLGVSAEAEETVQIYARLNALEWRDDPGAAVEIEARLQRLGFDAVSLDAEVYLQAQDQLELFDQLIQRAQQRRIMLLREMSVRREMAIKAQRTTEAVVGTIGASIVPSRPNCRPGPVKRISKSAKLVDVDKPKSRVISALQESSPIIVSDH